MNGPGTRSVIWVQGCPYRCPGCFNQDFLPFEGGAPTSANDLITRVLAVEDAEGISLSGGEPFSQAEALLPFVSAVVAESRSVLIFSGHTRDAIAAADDPAWQSLLSITDLLIAGPYRRDIPSTHPLLGSGNQELVFVSDRYRDYDFGRRRAGEFTITPDGNLELSGLL